jgi:hypothetical protein
MLSLDQSAAAPVGQPQLSAASCCWSVSTPPYSPSRRLRPAAVAAELLNLACPYPCPRPTPTPSCEFFIRVSSGAKITAGKQQQRGGNQQEISMHGDEKIPYYGCSQWRKCTEELYSCTAHRSPVHALEYSELRSVGRCHASIVRL